MVNPYFINGIMSFLRSFPVPHQPSRGQYVPVLKRLYETSPQKDEYKTPSLASGLLLKTELENVCKGPLIKTHFSDLRPISEILHLRFIDDWIINNSPNTSPLTDTIYAREFYCTISRIVQHFFSLQVAEQNIKKLIQFLNELEIYTTAELIKALVFNKNSIFISLEKYIE
ncbi:unnamed protein product [Didymodactylos carnosus]|uniref:Uncharacterized protein n=1 Tax=Didymodactylos carnosus TaxID=1234261 RepID=A0A815T8W9_9BILA|nr:unnamed protein product [Didymodactylos carnosus]CAF1501645.1 unnamed protein product [Didymodactylos carnosus]CAF4187803.1 unnamed protein product [Didymodactylos carnosus]CAF4363276.1 unnamed protein product [Didymodactylos carnosus]